MDKGKYSIISNEHSQILRYQSPTCNPTMGVMDFNESEQEEE